MTIATVVSITGQAWARDEAGNLRELSVGDALQEGETLVTSDNGRVALDFGDGLEPTVIEGGQEVAMTSDLAADEPVASEEASAQDDDIEALLAAIEEGEGDLLEDLDATAAGAGAAGGVEGGHGFVRLMRITEGVDPLAYQFGANALDGADQVEIAPSIVAEEDSVPTAGESSALVDDEGLAGGIDGGVGDDVGQGDETTFSGTLDFAFGGDGAGSVSLAAMDGATGTVGTESVRYAWDGATGTLTATVDGGARDGSELFSVVITDAQSGAYTVTLHDNVLHASLDGEAGDDTENDATAALTYTVQDADGSSANGTLTVRFDDDLPTASAEADQSVAEGDT
ncbi:retention module-containing protein, partial [Halomonas koreensis]